MHKQEVDLNNFMQELQLFKKQMFQQYGVLPDDLGRQDYLGMLEMLDSKPKEDRVMDAKDAGARLSSFL